MSNKTLTVLHIEDDEIDAMVLARAFKTLEIPHPIIRARDGLEALKMLRGDEGSKKLATNPNIVIIDLNMPRMNGIEFLREIRSDEQLKHLLVYVITTSNDEKDKAQAFQYNVAGYILKPVNFESFKEVLTALKNFWNVCEFP